MKCILAVLALLVAAAPSYAQTGVVCIPIGSFAPLAEKHGEYPAFSFRDSQYKVTFTMYINPLTKTYTLTGISDINPNSECISSVGTDFKPVIDPRKGINS